MSGNACDARDGRNSLRGDYPPLGDSRFLDAEFTSDPGPQTTIGGGAQQVHAEESSHSSTLSGAKSAGKPKMTAALLNLFRETKPKPWHILPMTIGERIRVARLAMGFTQRYVAKTLGVTPSAVNQWEGDDVKPSITNRAQLATLLGLRLDDLIPEAPIDEITEAIVRIVRGLPPHRQAALVIAIEGLAKVFDEPPLDSPATPRAGVKRRR